MISSKLTPLDPPLNMKKKLSDLLLQKIDYQTENIVDISDVKTSRSVNYDYNLSLQKKNLFDFITNDCVPENDIVFKETNEQKYKNFLKQIDYTSDNSDNNQNIDILIKNIKEENERLVAFSQQIELETLEIQKTIELGDPIYYNGCVKLNEKEKNIINIFNNLITEFKTNVYYS
jgi:hypothetical protein